MVWSTSIYGYETRTISHLKNCRKCNVEDKNIENFEFFGKTIFLQGENMSLTIYPLNITKIL
jgi:hypothetical protein